MARLVPRYLDPEAYAVVLGAADVSTYLLKKPWGHIMYTGSDRVGKIVAKAAAETLTPTTLEVRSVPPTISLPTAHRATEMKRACR
jgi:aldehyde dehydrogenase (NAD+)